MIQELESRLQEKDELIRDAKKKSEILEKQAIDAEKEAKEHKHKNEELTRQVRHPQR